MLFENTGEVLGGLETAGKNTSLDGHLRVPQQLDRFVDPDLVQVVQRGGRFRYWENSLRKYRSPTPVCDATSLIVISDW